MLWKFRAVILPLFSVFATYAYAVRRAQDFSPYCADLERVTSLCNEVFINILCPQTCQFERQGNEKPCGISKFGTNSFILQRKKRQDEKTNKTLAAKLEDAIKKNSNVQEIVKKEYEHENLVKHRVKRVVGGKPTKKGTFPWHIAIYYQGNQVCSGTLLTPDWIITAARCFDKNRASQNVDDWLIIAGEHSLYQSEGTEQVRDVKKILIHERNYKYWKFGFPDVPDDYDLALLKLDKPLKLDDYTNVVCLPGRLNNFQSNDYCKIVGWGKDNNALHDKLQEAMVRLVPRDICNLPVSYNGTVHERAICAGYQSGNADACDFDSGGSLACRKGKNWAALGLISWGFQCGNPKNYGVYTNLPLMKKWIIEMILSYDEKTNSIISIFERIATIHRGYADKNIFVKPYRTN